MDRFFWLSIALVFVFVTSEAAAAFNTVGRPVAADDTYAVRADSTLVVPAPGVLANDSDPDGDPLTTVLVSGASNGVVTLSRDGSFTYQPSPGFVGDDSFLYVANDGHTVSLRATVRINVLSTNPPAVSIVSPLHGVTLFGPATFSVVADATDSRATIERLQIFINDVAVADLAQPPFYFVASNYAAGSYRAMAVATSSSGLSTTSASVNIEVISNAVSAAGPLVWNNQSGLFEQFVTVSNATSEIWVRGVRISVCNLDATCQLWNATGISNGLPHIENNDPIPPHATVSFLLRYSVPAESSAPTPTLIAFPVEPSKTKVVPTITSINSSIGVAIEVRFASRPGGVYYLQCSEDFAHWKTEPSPIVSTGTSAVASQSRTNPRCFYRILQLP